MAKYFFLEVRGQRLVSLNADERGDTVGFQIGRKTTKKSGKPTRTTDFKKYFEICKI